MIFRSSKLKYLKLKHKVVFFTVVHYLFFMAYSLYLFHWMNYTFVVINTQTNEVNLYYVIKYPNFYNLCVYNLFVCHAISRIFAQKHSKKKTQYQKCEEINY